MGCFFKGHSPGQRGVAPAGVVVACFDCILVGTSSDQLALADESCRHFLKLISIFTPLGSKRNS